MSWKQIQYYRKWPKEKELIGKGENCLNHSKRKFWKKSSELKYRCFFKEYATVETPRSLGVGGFYIMNLFKKAKILIHNYTCSSYVQQKLIQNDLVVTYWYNFQRFGFKHRSGQVLDSNEYSFPKGYYVKLTYSLCSDSFCVRPSTSHEPVSSLMRPSSRTINGLSLNFIFLKVSFHQVNISLS